MLRAAQLIFKQGRLVKLDGILFDVIADKWIAPEHQTKRMNLPLRLATRFAQRLEENVAGLNHRRKPLLNDRRDSSHDKSRRDIRCARRTALSARRKCRASHDVNAGAA